MKSRIIDEIQREYRQRFNSDPLTVVSPGRINLIGEHTDYNEGFVLPAAIDKCIYFAIGKREDTRCLVHALDVDESFEFDTSLPVTSSRITWQNYILGVVARLKEISKVELGFECVFGGDIPIGSGMSSSAALEGGISFALNHLYNLELDRLSLAKVGQWAEHNYVGVKCGLMDQFANLFGQENKAIKLDCRSYEHQFYEADFKDHSLLLFDTCVKHSLGDSEYNHRREDCEEAVHILKQFYGEVTSLRDVTPKMLYENGDKLSERVYKRCAFVLAENDRVEQATSYLESGEFDEFGGLMYGSHKGLSTQYEVSCKELDFLVNMACESNEFLGSRMMGGGFGGCTINLIKTENEEQLINRMKKAYHSQFGIELLCHEVHISSGVRIL